MKKALLLVFSIIISTVTFAQQELPESQETNAYEIDAKSLDLKKNNLDGFKVFPNPTRTNLTVSIGNSNEGISFRISDVLGKLVYSRKIVSHDLQNNNFKLDMSSFKDGIYMFSMATKTASKTIKVVKL